MGKRSSAKISAVAPKAGSAPAKSIDEGRSESPMPLPAIRKNSARSNLEGRFSEGLIGTLLSVREKG
jgi:hypothetical protein